MENALRQFLDKYLAVSGEEFELIRSHMETRQFPRRTVLVREGEQEKYLSMVLQGVLRKYFYKGREEVITQLASEGHLISSSVSFFSAMPSQYVVETIEPVTLMSISREALDKLYIAIPKMERLGRLIITDLYLQKERWEQEHISLNTRERFAQFVEECPSLLQRVPQKYIASYLNIKPETLSRMKQSIKRTTVLTA
jgi:CRP-like cAMP-binding protein